MFRSCPAVRWLSTRRSSPSSSVGWPPTVLIRLGFRRIPPFAIAAYPVAI